jgi:hypothetical protein
MNKSIYIFGIFFSALIAVCSLLQSIISLQLGSPLYGLHSFVAWFSFTNILILGVAVYLFIYYQQKKYWVALSTETVAIIAHLFFILVIYKILILREWANYYNPALFIYLASNVIYTIGLVFSDAGKNFWLKMAGIYGLIIILALAVPFIWNLSGPTGPIIITLWKISLWVPIAGSLGPVLFIMQFITELKVLKTQKEHQPTRESVKNILGFASLVAFVLAVTLGIMISSEAYSQTYWAKQNFETTKKWVLSFEAHTFVNSKGDTLFYRLQKPLNYDPQKKYPLLVSLPYGGQPGTDKIRQVEGAVAAVALSADSNREKYPAFLFVPNCPPGSGWGGIPNYPSVDTLVYGAIESLDKDYSIDAKRRYVTGLSRGGYGTWKFICTRPDLFAAAIPVSGGGDPKLASKIVNIPVWAFHGAQDMNVPVSGSRNMISAIKKAGGNPKYTEYPNEAHNIWDKVMVTPGLWDWLFAQKRN